MKKLTRLKCLSCLILALAAALSLTACSADTASGVFPELSQIVGEIIQTAEESSPVTREFFQTQEPEEQPAKPERPDVPQTPGEGQEGFPQTDEESVQPDAPTESSIAEDGSYTTKEDVALYIHTYGKLPQNFITKKQARELGWGGGSLEPYAPGMCIGGDRFGNYRGSAAGGSQLYRVRRKHAGSLQPWRGADNILIGRADILHWRPLRELHIIIRRGINHENTYHRRCLHRQHVHYPRQIHCRVRFRGVLRRDPGFAARLPL